jgi:hypothetical protein
MAATGRGRGLCPLAVTAFLLTSSVLALAVARLGQLLVTRSSGARDLGEEVWRKSVSWPRPGPEDLGEMYGWDEESQRAMSLYGGWYMDSAMPALGVTRGGGPTTEIVEVAAASGPEEGPPSA